MYKDALGHELEIGYVCIKFYASSSSMQSELVVIREIREKSILADKPGLECENPDAPWAEWKYKKVLKPVNFYTSEYMVITDLSESQMKERCGIT